MTKYDVHIKRFALLVLPTFWRRPLIAAICYASVAPYTLIIAALSKYRRQTDYRLTHNGQVCHLRAVLNDAFDPIARRITLADQMDDRRVAMIYARDQQIAPLLHLRAEGDPMLLNRRGAGVQNSVDFWIELPLELHGKIDTARLKALVTTYKLASKRFTITYV